MDFRKGINAKFPPTSFTFFQVTKGEYIWIKLNQSHHKNKIQSTNDNILSYGLYLLKYIFFENSEDISTITKKIIFNNNNKMILM